MKWFHALFCVLAVQGCCPCFAASPRAVAVVNVAVAVDELLQTNTPDLPDDLGGGRDTVQPQPVNQVCTCGCGKTGCACGKSAAVGCAVQQKPVLLIDDATLAAVRPAKPRIVVTISSPASFPCSVCDVMEATAKKDGWYSGDADVEFRWIKQDVPGATNYPWITSEGRQTIYGKTDIAGIRYWLKLPAVSPSQAIGAVTVGTINGDAIRSVLSQVHAANAGGIIRVGDASLTVPAKMSTEVELTPDKLALRFTGAKPRLSYGSGWLAVSQPVNGITATRDLLTIGLDGFPDLCLRVE